MVENIKVNGWNRNFMGLVFINGRMVRSIVGSIQMIRNMAMDSTPYKMAEPMKVGGVKANSMELAPSYSKIVSLKFNTKFYR